MRVCTLVFHLFFLIGPLGAQQNESRLVLTNSGPIRGYKDPIENIFAFYGIPYAKAPSGLDRFKAPLPPPLWVEPLETVETGIICPQLDILGIVTNKTMQEDCLIANVYVPNTDKVNISVVVYIHGGGFIGGYGNLVTPKKIVASKEIIVVTFNYRLGAHGFLCLGTKDIPGNAGMKDQVALLRWVKQNIANFGGNSNDVTIAGYSAGSISVDLLLLSKSAKGLFKKVIPESGSNMSPPGVQGDPIKNAKEYAKLLKFDNDDIHALEEFYKSASYELLQSGFVLFRTDAEILTSPCVERDIGQEMFLEDSPYNILSSGNFDSYPMLYGFANMEGLLNIGYFDQWKNRMNENFADFIPADLQFKSDEEKDTIVKKIKRFYFRDMPIGEKQVIAYVNYFSDVIFACPTLRSVNLQLKAGNKNVYLYQYSFIEETTPVVPHTNIRGTDHCFQTIAVLDGLKFDTISDESGMSDDFRKMKGIMRELWTTFAKNGQPTSIGVPSWPPVANNSSPYMDLKTNPELKQFLLKNRCSFWEKIYEKHYKNPIPPYSFNVLPKTEL